MCMLVKYTLTVHTGHQTCNPVMALPLVELETGGMELGDLF